MTPDSADFSSCSLFRVTVVAACHITEGPLQIKDKSIMLNIIEAPLYPDIAQLYCCRTAVSIENGLGKLETSGTGGAPFGQ